MSLSADHAMHDALLCAVMPPEASRKPIQRRVALTASEIAAADLVASREGMARGTWIAKIVRMVLADAAEPSPDEMRALTRATAEMKSLTGSLARLARAIERSTAGEADPADRPDTDELATLVRQLETRLDAHAETTARTLRASHERWAIGQVRGAGER